jgi:hypothetical protein
VIAARDWWQRADSVEVAIVDAMRWINEALTAADLARIFAGSLHPALLVDRLRRLVSEGVVEVVDSRQMRGVTVRRYRVVSEVR